MEKKYGSLGRAVLRSPAATKGGGSLFRTLRGGLGTLTEKLAEGLAVVRRGEVEAIERNETGFRVRVAGTQVESGGTRRGDPGLSGLGGGGRAGGGARCAALAALLGAIPYTSSVTVALCYDAAKFDGKRAGHGFLIPRVERARAWPRTFVGSKFDHRTPANRTRCAASSGACGR